MAGSQLKRLKSSLREQGIVGPQKSKKQKRQFAQDEKAKTDKRLQRGAALGQIREQFNPFDLKHNPRGPKFEVTTNRPQTGAAAKGIHGRPTEAKSLGEQRRRETLLVEMQKRNKVGGILDRRFGENDPSLAEEEKMLERFAREKQRTHKKTSLFDLEETEPLGELTHMGQTLNFEHHADMADDFDEDDLGEDDDSDSSLSEKKRLKRLRNAGLGDDDEAAADEPDRKKSKKEVMEEVIAKSKMHKYERQVAKDEDEDLRMELDKELPNLHALLMSHGKSDAQKKEEASKLIAGVDKTTFDKEFDLRLKKLVQDRRAAPTERTKTDEEMAAEESKRLKELEEKRLKRMRGESVSDDEDSDEEMEDQAAEEPAFQFIPEEEDEDFGLGKGIKTKTRPTATELGFDDEDDFLIEDDLIASGSDLEPIESEEEESDEEEEYQGDDSEDDEFTKGLLNEEETKSSLFTNAGGKGGKSYEELLALSQKYPSDKLPTIVQRIRALYHPKLDSRNKEKLGNFSRALVDMVGNGPHDENSPSFQVLESLIRHIHSLAKMFPVEIANQYRSHLEEISQQRPLAVHVGDLTLLTAIGSTFPTSDHFHQVATPAMLTIGRYLGGKIPQTLSDYAIGIYLSTLAVQYQQFSKRYVPEVMSFSLNTLCAVAPSAVSKVSGSFPIHEPATGIRVANARKTKLRQLSPADCAIAEVSGAEAESKKTALIGTTLQLLGAAADTWTGKPSFHETFQPALDIVAHLSSKSSRSKLPEALGEQLDKSKLKLERMLKIAQLSRRPLELHHHRPLAIKTYIPKFEDSYDPNKHYDPDRERAEMAKLKKEHKKERKGAMRELRKDAQFMARENLRMKKAKDEAYEKKYKRLVAEIQNEEGKEANAYEREKEGRKKARHR
ncbi:putative nucleosome assembly protein [Colletotrichum spaethianum]|uniref:Nucleosome assembly protein n=1 Tax=Colletotrichum spaethianum TaxID=700344 RepID=A0AA37L8Y2_9PEZI|nr:putative nucleosome assembly protein [Colletotrichum spaethianum]GKT42179.1 putative nucleosome assembly protein [Colletotrichum spaethianum]